MVHVARRRLGWLRGLPSVRVGLGRSSRPFVGTGQAVLRLRVLASGHVGARFLRRGRERGVELGE